MARKLRTNEDLVRDLMTNSRHGTLAQAFVIEAITRYADQCAAADPKTFDSGMLNGVAWVSIAQEIKGKCDAFYGRKG